MSEQQSTHPELIDALYNLQALREMSGNEPELAVITGAEVEWEEDCTVVIDEKTGDRIVVTKLPLDQIDFDGATVWMSNVEEGVHLETDEWEVTSKDVIFWVNSAAQAKYFNPHSGMFSNIDPDILANRLDMPRIRPIPVSDYDPRYVPGDSDSHKFESIFTPTTDAYTLASKIVDRVALQTGNDKIKDKGMVIAEDNQATTFDLTLKEVEPLVGVYASCGPKGFDRRFVLQIFTGESLGFMVMPLGGGSTELMRGTGRVLNATVLREGILVSMMLGEKKILCLPSNNMKRFVDLVLLESVGRL